MKLIKAKLDDFIGQTSSVGHSNYYSIKTLKDFFRKSESIKLTIFNFSLDEESHSLIYCNSQLFELCNYFQKGLNRSTIGNPKL